MNEPTGYELPPKGFDVDDPGFQAPAEDGSSVQIAVDPNSSRLQLLAPFAEWEGTDLKSLKLLIKAKGKCTTDHISMAGPWHREQYFPDAQWQRHQAQQRQRRGDDRQQCDLRTERQRHCRQRYACPGQRASPMPARAA